MGGSGPKSKGGSDELGDSGRIGTADYGVEGAKRERSERFRQFVEGEGQRFTERLYEEYVLPNPQNILSSLPGRIFTPLRARRRRRCFSLSSAAGAAAPRSCWDLVGASDVQRFLGDVLLGGSPTFRSPTIALLEERRGENKS